MSKRSHTSGQADDEQPSTRALTVEQHTAIIMSRSIVVERDIKLADFNDLTFEGRTLPEVVEELGWLPLIHRTGYASKNMVREFYCSILQARDLEEPSMEVTVRNVPIIFSPNELANFLGYERDLAAFPNLPMSEMESVLQPTHCMVSDISRRLTALEQKVADMDVGWKKEVAVLKEVLKGVATGAELFPLTERVVLIEEHLRHVRQVLKLTDDDDDKQ
ncbi:hypothetical protein CJ030_MR1G023798 [Morella rubra]|uniref:Uncharacterized protein n=1 Tax=Morella rubra TaxID=262757 RepID=A0A6A1WS26_9ROSI|nr:hypothetical protein CJ030_MR1G023798 [Morella rubra]